MDRYESLANFFFGRPVVWQAQVQGYDLVLTGVA